MSAAGFLLGKFPGVAQKISQRDPEQPGVARTVRPRPSLNFTLRCGSLDFKSAKICLANSFKSVFFALQFPAADH